MADSVAHRRVPVILAILGMGRSGSTVLEGVLAERLGALAVGETRLFWCRGVLDNEYCGCGMRAHECRLWKSIVSEWDSSASLRHERLRRRVDRLQGFIPAVLGRHWPDIGRQRSSYLAAIQRLYDRIVEVESADIIIDSSKHPTYVSYLRRLKEAEVYIVHLVRDPRAVAFSWSSRKSRKDSDGIELMQRSGVAKSALEWLLKNTAALFLGSLRGSRYVRVTYEEFVSDPDDTVERICGTLAVRRRQSYCAESRLHGIAGNPDRVGVTQWSVREDRRWLAGLKGWQFALITAIASPLMWLFDYSLWPSRRRLPRNPSDR
jgi:hypothetical protein